jgi:uncharacterized membrane protein YhhN
VRLWQRLSVTLLLAAVLLLRAELAGAIAWVYVLKPLSTLLVIAVALPAALDRGDAYGRLVGIALGCSLVGDVLLMLPSDQFTGGLAAFLVAHLFYIGAFTRDGGFATAPASALPLAAMGTIVLALIWPVPGPLRLPVIAYMLVILTMAWQALERSRQGAHEGAWWAAVGALLFVTSDSALALARFRGDFPGARAVVLGTYFLAQWMIATSALVRAGRLATPPR